MKTWFFVVALLAVCIPGNAASRPHYLFVWGGQMADHGKDFISVIDADPASPSYGQILASLPVEIPTAMPHHTEYQMPADGILFANDFDAGETAMLDLRDPLHPRLAGKFGSMHGYSHPHSFVRLPNGHLLSTFQFQKGEKAGGLVELDANGGFIRAANAFDPTVPQVLAQPYGLAVLPQLDRVVSTESVMHLEEGTGTTVQVWRLSDLKLLKTIILPAGPAGYGQENPEEPRVLSDGKTVLVQTVGCGLYRVSGLEGFEPKAEWVHTFDGFACGVPVVSGKYWVESVPTIHGVVSLDVSDPTHPVEVSRISLGAGVQSHWLSLDPNGNRIVVTPEAPEYRVYIIHLEPNTGKLTLDTKFVGTDGKPGVNFYDRKFPDGFKGSAMIHGAVFSR